MIYDKCCNQQDHKIIEMIKQNPQSNLALSEGKVVIRKMTEDFSHIQPGTVNGKSCYQVKGSVLSARANVYIKAVLGGEIVEDGGDCINYDACMNGSGLSNYLAFSKK